MTLVVLLEKSLHQWSRYMSPAAIRGLVPLSAVSREKRAKGGQRARAGCPMKVNPRERAVL